MAGIKNSIGLIPVVTGRSWVNRTPNMDVSVLGTWNTCNSGLMTRADKLWACIVQRRFKRLARRGCRSLLYGLTPRDIHRIFPPRCPGGPRNPRRRRGRSRIGTYIPFFTHPIDQPRLVWPVSLNDQLHGRSRGWQLLVLSV